MKIFSFSQNLKGKYWTTYRASLSAFLQYRLNLALYATGHTISLTAIYFLWRTIYDSGYTLPNYSFESIIAYYILIALIRLTINEGTGMAFLVTNEIREGQITPFLTRPFSYPLRQFADVLAKTTLNLTIVIPIVFCLGYLFELGPYLPHGQAIIWGIAWSTLALTLYLFIYFLVAILSFWVDRAESYVYATIVFSNFFNGSLLPLDAFPAWFTIINNWLPFKYLVYIPIQAFLGRQQFSVLELGIGLGWILILASLVTIFWHRGLRRYESHGI